MLTCEGCPHACFGTQSHQCLCECMTTFFTEELPIIFAEGICRSKSEVVAWVEPLLPLPFFHLFWAWKLPWALELRIKIICWYCFFFLIRHSINIDSLCKHENYIIYTIIILKLIKNQFRKFFLVKTAQLNFMNFCENIYSLQNEISIEIYILPCYTSLYKKIILKYWFQIILLIFNFFMFYSFLFHDIYTYIHVIHTYVYKVWSAVFDCLINTGSLFLAYMNKYVLLFKPVGLYLILFNVISRVFRFPWSDF